MPTKKKIEKPKKTKEKEKEKPREKPKKKAKEEEPYLQAFGDIDSKFRFVHLAAKRAKSLLKGAKPKIKTKTKSPIRLAQVEVKEGLIEYRILTPSAEEAPEKEDRSFLGGDSVSVGEAEAEGEEALDSAALEEESAAEEEPGEEFEEELPEEFTPEKEED